MTAASSGESGATRPPRGGLTIGHFRLCSELGRGGAGTVFLAEDLDIPGRLVAVKIVRSNGIRPDLASIQREASALAALQHPHILVVHEIGTSPQGVYLVTEYMAGGSLAARLERGPLPLKEALHHAHAAAEALRAAHEKGILHRDIKPANLLLGEDGQLKMADFGLAWIHRVAASTESSSDQSTVSVPNARQPTVAGTARYIAPEVLLGSPPGPRTDQFSFGVTLHEILTGSRPHEGPGWAQSVISGHARLTPSLPADLSRIIRRCIAREPDLRYPDMDAVLSDLRAAIARRGPERKRLRLILGAGVLVPLLLLGGWGWIRWQGTRRARSLNETGRQALQSGDRARARRAFLAAHSADPAYLPACANLGYLAALEESPSWAVTILSECASTFPDSPVVSYNLGATLRLTGDLQGAETRLREALQKAPDSEIRPAVLNELALVLLARGGAAEALSLLAQEGPPVADTVEGAVLAKTLGLVLAESGKPIEAQRSLRDALAGPLPPQQRGIALAALGRILESEGDTAGAIEAYSQVLLEEADGQSERAAQEGLARIQGRSRAGVAP